MINYRLIIINIRRKNPEIKEFISSKDEIKEKSFINNIEISGIFHFTILAAFSLIIKRYTGNNEIIIYLLIISISLLVPVWRYINYLDAKTKSDN